MFCDQFFQTPFMSSPLTDKFIQQEGKIRKINHSKMKVIMRETQRYNLRIQRYPHYERYGLGLDIPLKPHVVQRVGLFGVV